MPNIKNSFVDPATGNCGATSSDGNAIVLTPTRVQQELALLSGNDPDVTRTTVQRALAQVISDTLGPANVSPDQVLLDYDDATGFITDLEFLG